MTLRLVFAFVINIVAVFVVIAENSSKEPCGIRISKDQYPWLVGIEFGPSYQPIPRIQCTGALIDNRHVLSKALCFNGHAFLGVAKSVRLGPYNDITGENCFGDYQDNNCTDIGAIRIPIETIITHPDYDENKNFLHPSGIHYDIALIRLRKKVPYTDLIRPICLPSMDITTLIATDQELIITGLTMDIYNLDKKEKHDEIMKYLEKSECENILEKAVAEDNICAKNVEGLAPCLKPGGLLMNRKRDRYELVGILEEKTSCATAKVFNNLHTHLVWIQSEIYKWIHGCGRRKVEHIELIMNGQATSPGDWPWHVALYRSKEYICGGTIISKTFILTAAHCVTIDGKPTPSELFNVTLGKHYLIGGSLETQDKRVHSVIVHEEFAPKNHLHNDIALLKLTTQINYNDYIQPACIWSSVADDRLPSNRDIGTVVGWGVDQFDWLASQLRQANIPMIPDATCINKNPLFYSKVLSNNKKFCAGWANGTSTCNGDSGGAFVMFVPDKAKDESFNVSGSWFIRGIVSLSAIKRNHKTCDPYQYAVFTDVSKYTTWIHRHLLDEIWTLSS